MSDRYKIGQTVQWKWGDGFGEGEIAERFSDKVTRTIDGTDVTRDASDDEPAYLITQQNGDRVLKSHSEIQDAE